MSLAPVGSTPAWWMWRAAVALVAVTASGAIAVSAEQTRPGSIPLAAEAGAPALEASLAPAVDAVMLHDGRLRKDQIALARRAAATDPLSPLPFYLLGAGGETRDARRAIDLALLRDPRFRPAYRWQALTRAKSGDIAGATTALIRLAVQMPREWQMWAPIAQLTADPRARAVIKAEIARGVLWEDVYLKALSDSSIDRAVVFEMLQSRGRRIGRASQPAAQAQPDDHRGFIAALVARKDYQGAYLAWVQWLPAASQAGAGLVFDAGFKGFAALPPFAWQLGDGVGGAATIDPASGLSLDYSGTDGAVVATQTTLLAAGRYRLATTARFDSVSNDNGAAPLVWNLVCADSGRALSELALPLDGTARHVAGGAFTVDASCPAQVLTLRVNSADFAKRLSGHIRSVAIEPVIG